MTTEVLTSPVRGVKAHKSMDLRDVFRSMDLVGGKDFKKRSMADRGTQSLSGSMLVGEGTTDREEKDAEKSISATGPRPARQRKDSGSKKRSRRRPEDPPRHHKSADNLAETSSGEPNLHSGNDNRRQDGDSNEDAEPPEKKEQSNQKPPSGGAGGERPRRGTTRRDGSPPKERKVSQHYQTHPMGNRHRHHRDREKDGQHNIKRGLRKSQSEYYHRHHRRDHKESGESGHRGSHQHRTRPPHGSNSRSNGPAASKSQGHSKMHCHSNGARRKQVGGGGSRQPSSHHHHSSSSHHQGMLSRRPQQHPRRQGSSRDLQENSKQSERKPPLKSPRRRTPISQPSPKRHGSSRDLSKNAKESERSKPPLRSPEPKAPEKDARPARPGIGVRAPSLRQIEENDGEEVFRKAQSLLTLEGHSPRSLADEADASFADMETTDDDEDDDGSDTKDRDSDASTVLQFDPTQDSNLFRVRQAVNDSSNFQFEKADGTSTEGHIAEIVDPIGVAEQHLRESGNQKKKELPIFDFLEQDDEADDELDFNDPCTKQQPTNYLSGGEEDAGGRPVALTDVDLEKDKEDESNVTEEGPRPGTTHPSDGEEESESDGDVGADPVARDFRPYSDNKRLGLILPSGEEDGGGAYDDDLDSWFPETPLPMINDAGLPVRRPSGAGDDELQQQPRRKVKRKPIKKKPAGEFNEDSDEENEVNIAEERQRRRNNMTNNKTKKKKKPARPEEDDPESSVNYDTDFSLDNVVEGPSSVRGLALCTDVPHHAPLPPSKIVNKLYTSICVDGDGGVGEDEELSEDNTDISEEEEDDNEEDDDSEGDDDKSNDEENNLCRPLTVGDTPYAFPPVSPASSKASSKSTISSIGRFFSRSRRNLSSNNGDGDDMSVGSRSIGGRLFGGKKQQHQLLGDDESSGTPF